MIPCTHASRFFKKFMRISYGACELSMEKHDHMWVRTCSE